jgi:hypothetical protein
MSIITKNNGVSNCICNGECWLLVHKDSLYKFHGQHRGVTTSIHDIEYFNTEQEMLDRATELGVEIPVEEDLTE